jgi:hypothetical protein
MTNLSESRQQAVGGTGWRDPWPSAQPDWHNPPWLMMGRAATAWFALPWEVLTRLLSPDLLPDAAPTVRTRLRFYDLAFRPVVFRPGRELEPREGHFCEGALGVPVLADGRPGEVSVFLWTNAEEYLTWGREAFGWPVRLAQVQLSGDLWHGDALVGATGAASLSERWGVASLDNVQIDRAVETGTPSGLWLTPRRLVHYDGGFHESRELLAVRPDVQRAGATFSGRGQVGFSFAEPHPLAALGVLDADVELADGFEIIVGGDVSIIPCPEGPD